MRQPRRTFSARRMFGAASLFAIAAAAPAMAEQEAQSFEIPSQPLSEAIAEFARQANLDVIAPSALTRGKTSKPVTGEMEPQKALQLLMSDAALDVRRSDGGTLILVQAVTDVPKPQTSPTADPAPLPATPRDPAKTADSLPTRATPLQRADSGSEEARTLDRVTVTGTSIRGLVPESSPLLIYNRTDIAASGASDAADFIRRTIPQVFGGGSSEFVSGGLPNDSSASFNNTFASGPNLRGLGSGATLTLVNGVRLPRSSSLGEFVDVQTIPISAIERIDVMTDGASSVYGSDAVAGVINLVLRDDYNGAETSLRFGSVTRGQLEEYRLSQTVGQSWQGGNAIATYEYFDRGNLRLSDRPSLPAPTLTAGAEIDNRDLFDLMPSQGRHSAVLAARQELSPSLRISISGLYSERTANNSAISALAVSSVSNTQAKTETKALAAEIEYDLTANWTVSIDGSYGDLKSHEFGRVVAPVPQNPYEYTTTSDLWSVGGLINGEMSTLPAGPIKLAIGGNFRHESLTYRLGQAAPSRDGAREIKALFGEVHIPIVSDANALSLAKRLELNASARFEEISDVGEAFNPKIGLLWAPADGLRFRTSYSTSFVAPPLGRTGQVSRTGAVVPYSFIRSVFGIELPDPSLGDVNYLILNVTDTPLEPEESTSFTVGVDYQFVKGPHEFEINATYYDIDFDGRLGTTPVPGNLTVNHVPGLAFLNPDLFPPGTVTFFPTAEEVNAAIASLTNIQFGGGLSTIENIGFINRAGAIRNLASTQTSGFDVQVNYAVQTGVGRVVAGLNANYINEFRKQATSTTPSVNAINTLYNPVDLKLRGALGLAKGGFVGNAYLNYVNRYRSDSTETSTPIKSWATIDLSMSYRFDVGTGWLKDTAFSLSATNVLDQMPPVTSSYGAFRIAGYDPTNASPLGRFISLELRKAF